jgi:hypothetical protein
LINGLLHLKILSDYAFKIERRNRAGLGNASAPVPPDWKKVALNQSTDMKNIQDSLNKAASYLTGYRTVPDQALSDLVNVIGKKAGFANAISSTLAGIINTAANLNNQTGIYMLNMPPGLGGNSRIKAELRDCPLERSTNQYTILLLWVAGGPDITGVDNYRKAIL